MNEMDLQTYSVAIQNARDNIGDATNFITQALGDVVIVDVTLLVRAREKMGTARDQLRHLANDMTDDFVEGYGSSVAISDMWFEMRDEIRAMVNEFDKSVSSLLSDKEGS